jgi:signal transduction histidine kinase
MQQYSTTPQTQSIIEALWRLEKIILRELDFDNVVDKIVNSLLVELGYFELGYKIIVLTLVDEEKGVLERVSLSQTDEAAKALAASAVAFHDIEIPLTTPDNILIKTIDEKEPQVTGYWPKMFYPVLNDEQALANQKAAGIKTSLTYPVVVGEKVIGVLIFSMTKEENEVSEDEKSLISGFTDIVGLAVQNARLHTSVRETARELETANQHLKELDEAKDEFISMASHQLRTPLTTIKGYLSMLLEGDAGKLNKSQRQFVDQAFVGSQRMVYLISDMLNVSRISTGKLTIDKKELDLVDLLQSEIYQLRQQAETREVTLTFHPPEDSHIQFRGDEGKIRQVIMNFVDNAIYYAPKGNVDVYLEKTDGDVEVRVVDDGIGVAEEAQKQLFTKFFRAENARQVRPDGTGLGLYMAKQVIEAQGGEILFESTEGAGSMFGFRFPLENQEVDQ